MTASIDVFASVSLVTHTADLVIGMEAPVPQYIITLLLIEIGDWWIQLNYLKRAENLIESPQEHLE